MVMRGCLILGVHSLSFKVCLKVLTLYSNLASVTDLEPYEIAPVDDAADCPFRHLKRISNLPKRKEFQHTPPGSIWAYLFITGTQ